MGKGAGVKKGDRDKNEKNSSQSAKDRLFSCRTVLTQMASSLWQVCVPDKHSSSSEQTISCWLVQSSSLVKPSGQSVRQGVQVRPSPKKPLLQTGVEEKEEDEQEKGKARV